MLATERISGIDRQYRLGIHVFAPAKKLQQSHAVAGTVSPRTTMAGPLIQRANSFLPIKPGRDGVAFQIISTGKPQKAGIQIHQHLHQVFAKTVRLVLPCWRKQGNQIKPDGARTIQGQDVTRPGRRFHLAGFQGNLVLLPILCQPGHFALCVNRVCHRRSEWRR